MGGPTARSWGTMVVVVGGVIGLSALLEAWPDPVDDVSIDFFKAAAPLTAVLGLAVFVELALVLEPYDPNKTMEKAFEALVRTVIGGNGLLIVVSSSAALYAIGSGRSTTFLLGCVVLPWILQLSVLVDAAYYRIGLHRLRKSA